MEQESVGKTVERLDARGPAPPAADAFPASPANTAATPMHAPAHAGPPYRVQPAWTPAPYAWKPKPKPAPFRVRELAALVAFAVVVDVACWSRDGAGVGGFGLAIFFAGAPALLAAAARARKPSIRLGAVAALLALVAVRSLLLPTWGTIVVGVGLVTVFGLALRVPKMWVPETIASLLSAVAMLPSRLGAAFGGVRRVVARTRMGRMSVLPIVVPLALGAVFFTVFALANPVVAHAAESAWRLLASIGLPSVGRVVTFVLALAVAASLLRPAIYRTKLAEEAGEAGEATPTALLVARNALVLLNVLFFAYDVLDATYLWSGKPPGGLTTQTYAHQGAFWLTVALVMLTAVVGAMFKGPLAQDPRAKTARLLAWVWMGQGLVLALGTYRRIAIHIAHSGLSDLRIVGILGTTLVVGGVVLVGAKLRGRRTFTWLVRRQLDAFVVTLAIYAVAPTDWISAKVNVARIASGEYGPLLHMFRQSKSEESAAALLPLLEHSDHRVRQGVAALLQEEAQHLRAESAQRRSWRERDVVTTRTLSTLDESRPRIEAELAGVDAGQARAALLDMSRVANDGGSLEELFAVPDADARANANAASSRGDVY